MSTITLYHYTTEDGAYGINQSRKIMRSTSTRDAKYGSGVYLTNMSPVTHGKGDIARGNWDGGVRGATSALRKGKTDCVFTVVIKRSAVECVNASRGIYLYRGDLYLNDSSVVEWWNVEETDSANTQQYLMAVSAGY